MRIKRIKRGRTRITGMGRINKAPEHGHRALRVLLGLSGLTTFIKAKKQGFASS